MTKEYIVHGDQYVNVRADPSTDNPPAGHVMNGDHIQVVDVTNGWARVELSAGLASLVGNDGVPAVGYLYAALLEPVTPPTPPTPTPALHHLGVNVIGQASLAEQAVTDGCKAVLIIDNPGVCEAIKQAHPDVTVINRRWTNWQIDGKQFYARYGSLGNGILNEVFNEQDSWAYDTPQHLDQRISYEMQYADLAAAKGHITLAGAYSMGCPDFTNPLICNTIKAMCAPRYNSDPLYHLSMHLYSPTLAHIDDDNALIWYETRWQFLFASCGFNPALRKIHCSETGIDIGSVGGFNAVNASNAQFRHWCDRWHEIQSQPFGVHPSPLCDAVIFGYTNGLDPKWQGYDTYRYRDVYKAMWQQGW